MEVLRSQIGDDDPTLRLEEQKAATTPKGWRDNHGGMSHQNQKSGPPGRC